MTEFYFRAKQPKQILQMVFALPADKITLRAS